MKVYVDIETIPSQQPAIKEQIAATLKEVPPLSIPTCPKSYKKESTIQAWYEETLPVLMLEAQKEYQLALEKRAADIEDKWRKTALSGEHGQIVCIGWAVEDEEPRALLYAAADCEKQLLHEFFTTLSQQLNQRPITWIGHNVQFDLRFLFQRAVIHDVYPNLSLHQDANPYGDLVYDTMQLWAGYRGFISLDKLCQTLGLPGKSPAITSNEDLDNAETDQQAALTNGSQVWDFIQQNRLDDVIDYCKADVERCRAVYKRLSFAAYLKPTTWISDLAPDTQPLSKQADSLEERNLSRSPSITA